ncbi:MAG: cobalamin-dependent protein [Dehalococcoidia bacterium]|nr:MAG: cobalamin-dependent protein [Dehalococcoidia bacterium]
MDILLVNASTKEKSRHASLNPPLGLAYIAAVLIEAGYGVYAVDLNIGGYNPRVLENIIASEHPQILGISAHTETYTTGLKVARYAKQKSPDITVIMGGTHATIMHDDTAQEPDVDVVVIGEGENTMLELADYFLNRRGSLSKINGIVYKDKSNIRITPERPFIENVDELPFPARHLFPMPLYGNAGQVLISRGGCPFNCRFCAVNNIWKGGRRFRSIDNVIEEIIHIYDNFQLDEINFADDTFTLVRERVIELCDKSYTLQSIFPWRWKCATRVDLVDKELLAKMYDSGCYSITYGIESGSQKILDYICKGITLDRVRQAIKNTLDVGIGVVCAFMFPHPWDTAETIREQKAFMKELLELGVTETLASTTPFPGTYYYENADVLGLKILVSDWSEYDAKHLMISTKNLNEDELTFLLDELVNEVGLKTESICLES